MDNYVDQDVDKQDAVNYDNKIVSAAAVTFCAVLCMLFFTIIFAMSILKLIDLIN